MSSAGNAGRTRLRRRQGRDRLQFRHGGDSTGHQLLHCGAAAEYIVAGPPFLVFGQHFRCCTFGQRGGVLEDGVEGRSGEEGYVLQAELILQGLDSAFFEVGDGRRIGAAFEYVERELVITRFKDFAYWGPGRRGCGTSVPKACRIVPHSGLGHSAHSS